MATEPSTSCSSRPTPAAAALFGVSPLAGRRLTELASPLEASWLEQWDRAIRTGEPQRADQPSADGTRWFDCTVTPIGGERAAIVFHDVTDHHAVEAALREREARPGPRPRRRGARHLVVGPRDWRRGDGPARRGDRGPAAG